MYVGAVHTNRVIRLDRDLEFRGEYKHNIHGPRGVTIDRRGTMYVANFTREMEFEASASEDFDLEAGRYSVARWLEVAGSPYGQPATSNASAQPRRNLAQGLAQRRSPLLGRRIARLLAERRRLRFQGSGQSFVRCADFELCCRAV